MPRIKWISIVKLTVGCTIGKWKPANLVWQVGLRTSGGGSFLSSQLGATILEPELKRYKVRYSN